MKVLALRVRIVISPGVLLSLNLVNKRAKLFWQVVQNSESTRLLLWSLESEVILKFYPCMYHPAFFHPHPRGSSRFFFSLGYKSPAGAVITEIALTKQHSPVDRHRKKMTQRTFRTLPDVLYWFVFFNGLFVS